MIKKESLKRGFTFLVIFAKPIFVKKKKLKSFVSTLTEYVHYTNSVPIRQPFIRLKFGYSSSNQILIGCDGSDDGF